MRLLLILFLTASSLCYSDYTLREGRIIERKQIAKKSSTEHHSNLLEYYHNKAWNKLEKEAQIVIKNFERTPFARDAVYFLGVAYYEKGDYDLADQQFTIYLTSQSTPKYFEEAIQHKYEIAEKFRDGAKAHLIGKKSMPKWQPARKKAIAIYDEVISAMPHHELAAHSLYGKAQIYFRNQDWRSAIESYQTLIRRFPKHPLSIESYIGIGEVYKEQAEREFPDPDLLDLSELNLRKFYASFPGEEKVSLAEVNYANMRDHYAAALFDTARFYERTNKWGAAKIYYTKIIHNYPTSPIAIKSQYRLELVEKKLSRLEARKQKK